jgi:hypothetical protein
MGLSTAPGRYLVKSLRTQRKVEFPSRFSPPPRDRLGRGRPSPIDGRPPAAGFGEVRPDQEQGARSIGEEKMIDRATAELTDEPAEAQ